MRLHVTWGLRPLRGEPPNEELPLAIELDDARASISHTPETETLDLFVDVPVNSSKLRLAERDDKRDIKPEERRIEVDEVEVAHAIARRVADAVSFITQHPLTLFGTLENEPQLVSESEDDLSVLEALGATHVSRGWSGSPGVLLNVALTGGNIASLCERASGIRLYADALKMGTSSGQVRELWRVLEAAFGAKNEALVGLLARCAAAQDMEFTEQELRELLTLRGRASHAYSRPDLDEIVAVEHQASAVVNRLRGLAEALVIRKTDWGVRTVGVEPLPSRLPYVRSDGSIVIYRSRQDDG